MERAGLEPAASGLQNRRFAAVLRGEDASYADSVRLGRVRSVYSGTRFGTRIAAPDERPPGTRRPRRGARPRRVGGMAVASFADVDADGLVDLVVHVTTAALQLSVTDIEAVLEGRRSMRRRSAAPIRPDR